MITPPPPPPRTWLVLIYTVPRSPSASRVYVWRKLQRLGAIMLQDAAWILPATSRTREHFQWLSGEIKELAGSVTLLESHLTHPADEAALIQQFESHLTTPYRQILASLQRKSPDLPSLSRRYQQLQSQDYFQSALGQKVRAALVAARGGAS